MVVAHDVDSLPPRYDLAEAQRDLTMLDLLRPRFSRLRLLISRADDTEMALGSDILSAAPEGSLAILWATASSLREAAL